MSVRLTSGLLAGALIRRVQGEGGGAMVLAKGDETSGSILLVTLEKGVNTGVWERLLQPSGAYRWMKVGPQDVENEEQLTHYIERRRQRDPDLWLIELNIPNAERFIVETDSLG
jgi:hypothetical protein